MNWKRGLVRLWIVSTVVWVALVGTYLRADVHWNGYLQYRNVPTDLTDRERNASDLSASEKRRAEWKIEVRYRFDSDRRQLIRAAAIAGGPPFSILLLGLAFRWAVRGFRRGGGGA